MFCSVFLFLNREAILWDFHPHWSLPFGNRWPPYLREFCSDYLTLKMDLNRQWLGVREPEEGHKPIVSIGLKGHPMIEQTQLESQRAREEVRGQETRAEAEIKNTES